MRFFMLLVLSLTLTGLVGCGEDQTPDKLKDAKTIDGADADGKPTSEEKRQMAAARNQMVAVVHKSAQILAMDDQKSVIRAVLTINNQDTSPMTFVMDGKADVITYDIDKANGVKLEVLFVREVQGNGTRTLLGLEYRMSRQAGTKTYTASQFISLNAALLNSNQALFKQKFEFPSKSNLYTWIKQ